MKQKFIIGLSVLLLLLAVFLIARDLFRNSPSFITTDCCGEDGALKEFDPSLIGFTKIKVIATGLNNLSGITTNNNGQIFVCGNEQVVAYDTSGNKTAEFATDTMANCIAFKNDIIYIGTGAYITEYNKNGDLIDKWKPFKSDGYLTSLAPGDDFIYAADAMSKRILKYSYNGELEMTFGKKDSLTGAPGFVIPSLYFDVAYGGFNDLWLVNPGWLRLENYSTSGSLRSSWGKASFENSGFTGCCNPVHMALLPDGSFVTYEKGIDKIKLFDQAGQFQCMVAGAGSFRENADFQLGNNNLVKDITTDSRGFIYILDAYNEINIFKKNAI